MLKCNDPAIGNLLHLYELDAISEEESDQFQIHMMQCDYCFNEVNEFVKNTDIIKHSTKIQELADKAITSHKKPEGIFGKLKNLLWPQTPIVFRPVIIYLLIAIMAFPAYFGLFKILETDSKVRPVQTITLTQTRSNRNNTFKINKNLDGIIEFTLFQFSPDNSYSLSIKSEFGEAILFIDNYSGFDEYGMGQLFFPISKMSKGNYILLFIETAQDGAQNKYEYRYNVVL